MASKFKSKIAKRHTPRTLGAGLSRWECPNHGWIVDVVTCPEALVWCPCGRRGKVTDIREAE